MFPALQGGFLTTGPSGKSLRFIFLKLKYLRYIDEQIMITRQSFPQRQTNTKNISISIYISICLSVHRETEKEFSHTKVMIDKPEISKWA